MENIFSRKQEKLNKLTCLNVVFYVKIFLFLLNLYLTNEFIGLQTLPCSATTVRHPDSFRNKGKTQLHNQRRHRRTMRHSHPPCPFRKSHQPIPQLPRLQRNPIRCLKHLVASKTLPALLHIPCRKTKTKLTSTLQRPRPRMGPCLAHLLGPQKPPPPLREPVPEPLSPASKPPAEPEPPTALEYLSTRWVEQIQAQCPPASSC